jgi:hypothetical protein
LQLINLFARQNIFVKPDVPVISLSVDQHVSSVILGNYHREENMSVQQAVFLDLDLIRHQRNVFLVFLGIAIQSTTRLLVKFVLLDSIWVTLELLRVTAVGKDRFPRMRDHTLVLIANQEKQHLPCEILVKTVCLESMLRFQGCGIVEIVISTQFHHRDPQHARFVLNSERALMLQKIRAKSALLENFLLFT